MRTYGSEGEKFSILYFHIVKFPQGKYVFHACFFKFFNNSRCFDDHL